MNNQHFVAEYVAKETGRLSHSVEHMLDTLKPPTDAEKEALLAELETSLQSLQGAVHYLATHALHTAPLEDAMTPPIFH